MSKQAVNKPAPIPEVYNRLWYEEPGWKESFGLGMTQARAWKLCPHGKWMLQQWHLLPKNIKKATRPGLDLSLNRIVKRAIRRTIGWIPSKEPWVDQWEQWARSWQSKKDQTEKSAWAIIKIIPMDVTKSIDRIATELTLSATTAAACVATKEENAPLWIISEATADNAAWRSPAFDYMLSQAVEFDPLQESEFTPTAMAAAWFTENIYQARDIRRGLPKWPGEE